MALATPIEPLEHQAMHRMIKLVQCAAVVGHAKVIEVTTQLPRNRPPQVWQGTRGALHAEPVIDIHQYPLGLAFPKGNELGLGLIQPQTVLAQSEREDPHEPLDMRSK